MATQMPSSLEIAQDAPLRPVAEIAEERRQQENLYHTAPVSLRFVDSSPAFLSMMHDRPSCIMEIIMVTGTKKLYEMMDRYEKELYSFGGRPHWGQVNTITADPNHLRSLYPKYDRWLEISRRLNGNGTFDSPFSERVGFPAARAVYYGLAVYPRASLTVKAPDFPRRRSDKV